MNMYHWGQRLLGGLLTAALILQQGGVTAFAAEPAEREVVAEQALEEQESGAKPENEPKPEKSSTESRSQLAITGQPQDYEGELGSTVKFQVTATGSGLSYQWQLSDNGKDWRNSSTTKNVYTTTLTQVNDGRQVRCVVKDSAGNKVTSEAAQMRVKAKLAITQQPKDYEGELGSTVKFQVTATGSGLSYQWQLSDNGKDWRNSSTTKNVYTTTLTQVNDGRQVRCVVKDSAGNKVTSEAAQMRVKAKLAITEQPQDYEGELGSTVKFQVTATGSGLSYQWQLSDNGTDWRNSSTTKNVYTTTLTQVNDGRQVRCVVKDSAGNKMTSEAAQMRVKAELAITGQPEDFFGALGETVHFSVTATGSGLSYQWQLSDNGTDWRNSSTKKSTYTTTLTQVNDGRQVRCVVTDSTGKSVTSRPAVMEQKIPLAITGQPEDGTGPVGETVSFTVQAEGNRLTYQWEISRDAGKTWENPGETSNRLSAVIEDSTQDLQVRCRVKDCFGNQLISRVATLTKEGLTVLAEPEDYSGLVNDVVQFIFQVQGEDVSYQWQLSDDGGKTWRQSSIQANTYSATLTKANSGRMVRCIATDGAGRQVISRAASMALDPDFQGGFFTRNGKTYYRDPDGTYRTGLQVIDQETYYFNTKGVMQYGYFKIGDFRYYFDETTGRAITGLKTVASNGNTYYFQGGKGAAVGLLQTQEGIRYFNSSAIMLTGYRTVEGNYYYFQPGTGLAAQGMYTDPATQESYYFDGLHGALTGFQTVDGKTYYFDTDYTMARGMTDIHGKRYYFDVKTGEMTQGGLIKMGDGAYVYVLPEGGTAAGLYTVDGKLYHFDEKTGKALSGLQTVGDATYYFSPDTLTAQTGFVTLNSNTYYFGSDYKMVTGMRKIDGSLYYFSNKGYLYTGLWKNQGEVYYFHQDTGAAVTGWYTTSSNARYYFHPDTGKAVSGWQQIDGALYFFEDSCMQRTGLVRDGEGRAYYYKETGEAFSGWLTRDNNKYYFAPDDHRAVTGLQTIDKHLYCFDSQGVMRTGMRTVGEKNYSFSRETGAAQSGFFTSSTGYTRYYDEKSFEMVTGLQTIDGNLYYFDDTGVMQKGYKSLEGACYFFDTATGAAKTGFIQMTDGNQRYTLYGDPATHQLATGLRTIEDGLYGFKPSGIMRTGFYTEGGSTYYFDPVTGRAQIGFVNQSGKILYLGTDGRNLSGVQVIDGNVYGFTDAGRRQSGMMTIDGVRYCFDDETGIALGGVILNPSNQSLYALDSKGGIQTGTVTHWGTEYQANASGILKVSATGTVDGLQRYYDANGERQYGMISYTTSAGQSYTVYFGPNGNVTKKSELEALQRQLKDALQQDGWHEIGGLKYYVKNGALATGVVKIDGQLYGFAQVSGALMTGLRKIDGSYYYLDEEGKAQRGFVTRAGETRCFDQNGKMVTGFVELDGGRYYFLSNGVMAKGTFCIGDKIYAADAHTGVLATGGAYDDSGAKLQSGWKTGEDGKYYLDGNGTRVTGEQLIDGRIYCFDQDGVLYTGFQTYGSTIVYYTESGRAEGWQRIDGNTYYFSPKDGAMAVGIQSIDQRVYFFNEKGIRQVGFVTAQNGNVYYFTEEGVATGWMELDGTRCYFDDQGVMQVGLKELEGKVYYFDSKGVQQFGEVTIASDTYYFDPETGVRMTGLIAQGEDLYYFSEITGKKMTGCQEIDGKRYYFNPETGARQMGFVYENNHVVCYDDSALGVKTGLQEIGGKWYEFNETDGTARTGYRLVDGVMYYFDPETGASVSGIFQASNGFQYYFQAGGGIAYGLQSVNGKKFYFYPTNGRKVDGLQSVGEKLYYFDAHQGMLTNTTVTVAGLAFSLGADGAATVLGDSDLAKMVREGMGYLGQPYKTESEAGSVLSCSGFVNMVLKTVGIDLKGSSYRQYYEAINNPDYQIMEGLESAKPGDILFYTNLDCQYGENCHFWNEIHHVAIYLGDGKVLHSTTHFNPDHPELDCVQVEDSMESNGYFLNTIVRVLSR